MDGWGNCKHSPPPGARTQRQDVVNYVASSSAGFYVLDVQLTTPLVIKTLYVWCVVGVFMRWAALEPRW